VCSRAVLKTKSPFCYLAYNSTKPFCQPSDSRPRHAGGTGQNELKNRVLDFATDVKQITEDFAVRTRIFASWCGARFMPRSVRRPPRVHAIRLVGRSSSRSHRRSEPFQRRLRYLFFSLPKISFNPACPVSASRSDPSVHPVAIRLASRIASSTLPKSLSPACSSSATLRG
jgi:hypothetical protein